MTTQSELRAALEAVLEPDFYAPITSRSGQRCCMFCDSWWWWSDVEEHEDDCPVKHARELLARDDDETEA